MHDDRVESGPDLCSELGEHPRLVEECALVTEKHLRVTHGDHVVVEDARIDGVRVLLREDDPRRIEPVPPRDRDRRLARLPCRKSPRDGTRVVERDAAVDEEFDAALARAVEARVVRCAFVAELWRSGQRIMHDEPPGVCEHRAQHSRRHRSLERAVEVAHQVRRREVDPAVGGVGRRAHRRGIGDPHCRRRRAGGQQARRIAGG